MISLICGTAGLIIACTSTNIYAAFWCILAAWVAEIIGTLLRE